MLAQAFFFQEIEAKLHQFKQEVTNVCLIVHVLYKNWEKSLQILTLVW